MRKQFTFLMTVAIMSACQSTTETASPQHAKPVKVQALTPQQSAEKIYFNGQVAEQKEVMVSFRVGGPLSSLKVNSGDYVKKGTVIATIDSRDYEIALRQAKAQWEQVSSEYERYTALFEKGKLPANNYDKIKSGYKMAKVAYDQATNQLQDTQLRAPFSGYISNKMANNFETVGPGQPIVALIDAQALEIVVGVPASRIEAVKSAKHFTVDIKNAGVQDLPVQLLSVNAKNGPDKLYEARFQLSPANQATIKTGMAVRMALEASTSDTAINSVPVEALMNKSGQDMVWVYDAQAGIAKTKAVRTGALLNDGQIEILSGLSAQDKVITAGAHSLYEGQKVKPIKNSTKTNIGGLL
ncbi:efflux RND transporter periplasmic adaptor subunit [Persicobacter sp. CCB-QB2]|uniref:efflux RND transporter periplasmic adaptor subunit n=1 Tax=Persicobacter sp. CCB-QB2 TaxID=1561025 RepID=UPI0009E62211|nr:efflux RND transporter periplasmic adaptor subunit [Persicobacter sp. CCB-QB2]